MSEIIGKNDRSVKSSSRTFFMSETMVTKKINLGGGNDRMPGYINIDILALPNVDIVHDLATGIPLPDGSVEEVYTTHFLEHLSDVVFMMKEIYRVCAPGALVKIKAPYFKSVGAFKDPTHKSFFTEKTFAYFNQGAVDHHELPDYNLGVNFVTEKIAYVWAAPWLRYLPGKKIFWLKYFWNIARSIYYELRVIK